MYLASDWNETYLTVIAGFLENAPKAWANWKIQRYMEFIEYINNKVSSSSSGLVLTFHLEHTNPNLLHQYHSSLMFSNKPLVSAQNNNVKMLDQLLVKLSWYLSFVLMLMTFVQS